MSQCLPIVYIMLGILPCVKIRYIPTVRRERYIHNYSERKKREKSMKRRGREARRGRGGGGKKELFYPRKNPI